MKVRDVMTSPVVSVQAGTSLKDASRLLVERRISGLPVVDADGHLVGVLSEADVLVQEVGASSGRRGPLARLTATRRADERAKPDARLVGDAMTAPAITTGPDRPLSAVATSMLEKGVNRLPVVDREGKLLGIVTRADMVRAFVRPDGEIERELKEDVIHRAMLIEPGVVQVEVDEGEAVLRGRLEQRRDAEILAKLAAGVPGVVAVDSELTWLRDG